MKEYVIVLKKLFNLENVTYKGEFVNVTDIQTTGLLLPIYRSKLDLKC